MLAMANNKPERIFNIAVVGMSGITKDRGDLGVGKSCLCNRFVRPDEDDFHPRHSSTISTADFSSRIINRDNFLYWGELSRQFDGTNFTFRVVEHTEFTDDTSFAVLKPTNKTYHKRCAENKLSSPEKVAYICPDQLGDEQSFPKQALPGGKFQVDGYLLVFDVSNVRGRSITKQREFVGKLHSTIVQKKKPIVLVATKFDSMEEMSWNDLKQFARDKKLSLVESSALQGVNFNLPFCLLASMIDKNRSRPRELTYMEASQKRKDLVDAAERRYFQILDGRVKDYRAVWSSTKAELEKLDLYKGYVALAGTAMAKKKFRNHTKRLKEEHRNRKLKLYLSRMSGMLVDIYSDLETINGRYWSACRDALETHPRFDDWFIRLDQPWADSEYLNEDDDRIPFELMKEQAHSAWVEKYFQDHVEALQLAKRKERYKSDFRTMLGTLQSIILPGSNFHEMRLHLENLECYQNLEEQERMAVFIAHQNEIFQRAMEDLLELLLERVKLFIELDKGGKVLEQVNMLQDELSSDERFTRLSKFSSERYVMIIKQFAFMNNLVMNSCYLHRQERCIESQIRDYIGTKLQRCNTLPIRLLLLGTDGLAVELAKEIRELTKGGFRLNESLVEIETEILDLKAPTTDIDQMRSFHFDGCICVFTSLQSFEYIKTMLEQTKIVEDDDGKAKVLSHIPVSLMFGRDSSIPESDSALRDEAQSLAERISDCTVVDLPEEGMSPGRKFFPLQIQSTIQSLNEMSTFRVALVMMCGDNYSIEPTLSYLMKEHNCQVKSACEFCVVMEMTFQGHKQKMELEVVSYHQAFLNCKTTHHGYVLCYSPERNASLQIMKTFTAKTAGVPTMILALSDEGYISHSELVTEGQDLADKFDSIEFMKARSNFLHSNLMSPKNHFFESVFNRRKATEKTHQELFYPPCGTPSSDDEEYSDGTPDNELEDGFERLSTSDTASLGSSASRDDVTSMTEASSIGEGDTVSRKKFEMRKRRRRIGRKLVDKQKEEKFLQSLEQLMESALLVSLSPDAVTQGQTTPDNKGQKQTATDEPHRKWWFKTRKPKGFLRGVVIEDLQVGSTGIPSFVERCVALIEEKGLTIEGIYRKPGKAADVENVINRVDKDPNFAIGTLSINVHAVASSFKQYFSALSGPFIPYKVQTDLIKKFNDLPPAEFLVQLKACIGNLGPKRYALLKYLLQHLQRIIDNRESNRMNMDNISICWWPCLLHPQSKSIKDLTNEAKLASIFTILLENMDMILGLEVEMAEDALGPGTAQEDAEVAHRNMESGSRENVNLTERDV